MKYQQNIGDFLLIVHDAIVGLHKEGNNIYRHFVNFKMPKNAGRKPGYQSRKRHKESPDIIIDRLSTSTPSVPIVTPSPSEEHVIENVAATEEVRFLDPRESIPEVFEKSSKTNYKMPRYVR